MPAPAPSKVSKAQIKYLQALRRRLGVSDEVYSEMKRSVGVTSTVDLTNSQFDDLVKRLEGSVDRKVSRSRIDAWKPLHSSAQKSGMHNRPSVDKEEMIRKIEAILTELKRPWSYADGMAKKMFGVETLRFCDRRQTYRLLQALCVYQERLEKKEMEGAEHQKPEAGKQPDWQFYLKELKSEQCQCGKRKGSGKSFCYGCWKRLPPDLQKPLYKRIGEGYEAAYEAAVTYLDTKGYQSE